jgi:hypothetical protein
MIFGHCASFMNIINFLSNHMPHRLPTSAVDKDAMMAIQRAERLETLKAFCGSSHAFYEAVWMQLGTITLPVGQSGETKTTQIHLFDDSFPAGAVPTTDECLLFQIAKALDLMPNRRNETTVADLRHVVEQDEVGKDALTQAKLYYRGVGHIMASCLGTNGVISPNALPQLFQNGRSLLWFRFCFVSCAFV